MAITTQCACGKTISAKNELSGRRVKCPHCQQSITLPGTRPASPVPDTIRTTCHCGKSFHAKLQLAGKTVKCPGCNQPVTIIRKSASGNLAPPPATSSGIDVRCPCGRPIKAPLRLAGKTIRCPSCSAPLAIPISAAADGPCADDDVADDFGLGNELADVESLPSLHDQGIDSDISGLAGLLDELGLEASKTGLRCPSCRNDVAAEDVLCTRCGYNLETGKQLKKSSFVKDKGPSNIGPPTKKKDRKGMLGLFGKK